MQSLGGRSYPYYTEAVNNATVAAHWSQNVIATRGSEQQTAAAGERPTFAAAPATAQYSSTTGQACMTVSSSFC